MIYSIFVILSIVLLCIYHSKKCSNDIYINMIFFLIWVIFSIEFYTTKDYGVYYNGFYRIEQQENWEPLYVCLVKMFKPFGFVVFNSCVAAFEIFTLCYFLKRIVLPRYRWISILILILSTDNLFLFMNLKRQFFAMMVAIWIVYYVLYSENKYRYLISILIFFCAINIHSSAYISLGYFLLPLFNFRFNKYTILLVICIYLASLNFKLSTFSDQLFLLLSATDANADYYDVYITQQEDYESVSTGMGFFNILYNISLFILFLLFHNKHNDKHYKLVVFSIIGLILMNILKGNFFRLYFYYTIFTIFNVSNLLYVLKISKYKMIYICLLCLSLVIPMKSYYNAFIGDKITYMTIKYRHFYTIFDVNPDKKDYLF